ncbi:MAG TPA: GspE/PulE family protein [Candidatus Paceibacterota bacterium]|nr:GspE/PulE family protein [Candidatus Paceibacterota bacterium]
MAVNVPQTLVQELVRLGRTTRAQADELIAAATKDGKDVGAAFVEAGTVSDEELLKIKSELYRLPVFSLAEIEPDAAAFQEISEDVAGFYKIVPFAKSDGVLKVGIVNPEDIDALEALKFIATDKGLKLEKYVISYKDFAAILKKFRSLTGEVGKALESIVSQAAKEAEAGEPELKLEEITAESPVTQIVSSVLRHAIDQRASDIHVEPFEDRVRVRFRVDGVLLTSLELPKNLHSPVVTRVKILSNLKIDETRLAQDGRFSIMHNATKIDFRVSTFPTKNGEKIVMRILDPLASRVELAGLGIQGQQQQLLSEAMENPFGVILITGPTGSGKSTTIAAMLKELNNEEVNIVTLEDPIEYFIDGVNQSQTHEEIGYTFASGLRHILRQDPDIIMVGEIRDRETAALAVQASLTGHLVLSTLHTNDSLGVIPRLVDMGVERFLVPPTLVLAVAQRLLRRLCPDCKIQDTANVAEAKLINDALDAMPKDIADPLRAGQYALYRPNTENPCKTCGGKAFKGRIGIYEMLRMTPELEKIILTSLSEAALREEAQRQGMVTMFQDGIIKTLQGTVSIQELLEVAKAGEEEEAPPGAPAPAVA